MSEFRYIDTVKLGLNAANARVPRLQISAIKEFGELLSREVTAGEWVQDGETVINAAGQSPEQYLDHWVSTRPHALIPAVLVDAADDTWTSGNLTKQGARFRELKSFLGSDKAADKAMAEEAALYGAVPGSTKKGVKPGSEREEKPGSVSPNNPWSDKFHGTPQEALAEQTRLIRTLGTKGSASIAKAAGYSILGAKIAK
jgi:hypothetical protein